MPSLLQAGPRVAGVVARRLSEPSADLPVLAAWRKGPRHPLVEALLELLPLSPGAAPRRSDTGAAQR